MGSVFQVSSIRHIVPAGLRPKKKRAEEPEFLLQSNSRQPGYPGPAG